MRATISVTGHIILLPGGSPFLYQFDLYLTGGTISPSSGSNLTEFTVSGLVGVSVGGFIPADAPPGTPPNPQSGTTEPPGNGTATSELWYVPAGGIVTTNTGNPAPYDYASSVTWDYLIGPTITYSSTDPANNFLGSFTVQTIASFPDNMPPVTPGVTPIGVSYSIDGSPGTPTTITLLGAVPEPSSMLLLLVGGAVLPFMNRRRRRLRSRSAA